MAEPMNEHILEILWSIQTDIAGLKSNVREIRTHVGNLEV